MPRINSLKYIKEAAKNGDPYALFELAFAYDHGNGVPQDFKVSSELYQKASTSGHVGAKSNLLLQQVLGQASILSARETFEALALLASRGDQDAQNNIGLCHDIGYGTEQNYKKANLWFRRAAKSGLAAAQFNLGGAYLEGKGVRKDISKAISYYMQAAEQRDELALIQLANMYQKGLGVPVDLQRAFILYLCAYRQGSVRAANHLALLYKKGLGVEQDHVLAFQLFAESVSEFDSPSLRENLSYRTSACFRLGLSLEKGEGVEIDKDAALDWYRKGAALLEPACIKALERLVPKGMTRCKPISKL